MNQLDHHARRCIENSSRCHAVCLATAMTHCLEMGGEHTRPQHFRLMMDCVLICATTADFVAHKSQFHRQICALCAEVCGACAEDCVALSGMEDCIVACIACAEACREMT